MECFVSRTSYAAGLRSVFHGLIDQIMVRYWRLISRVDRYRILPRLREYVDAVRDEKGGLYVGCGAFLDGKFVATCRPTDPIDPLLQQSVYNGYYAGHGKRAMHLVFPDGIIVTSVGSVRRSDQFLRERDDLEAQIDTLFIPSAAHPNGDPNTPFLCWTDTAYAESGHFRRKRVGAGLTAAQVLMDASMDIPRKSVEHSFCRLVALFPFVDFKKSFVYEGVMLITCG